MAQVSERVRQRLAVLAQQFTESLPGRMDEIRNAGRAAFEQTGDRAEFRDFRNCLHKLAGTAGTFQFDSLSAISRSIETILDGAIEGVRRLDQRERSKVEELLTRLYQEATGRSAAAPACVDNDEPTAQRRTGATCGHTVYIHRDDTGVPRDLADQIGFFSMRVVFCDSFDDIDPAATAGGRATVLASVEFVARDPTIEKRLRVLKELANGTVLVVAVSAEDGFDTRLSAVRAGSDAFFAYPLAATQIVDRIDDLLEQGEQAPFHVLIVDDEPDQVGFYAMVLQRAGMITSVATDPRQIFRVMVEAKPDLVLVDMYMPGVNGDELAAIIRQQDAFVGVPIVFLSIERDYERQIEAIRYGGDDFLTKPIKPEHLVATVRIRARRNRALRFLVERDSLTGLLNHSNLKESLVNEVSRAVRLNGRVSFAMIDLDHFKQVNDVHGHLAGDRVLRSLARMLQDSTRKTDIVGRYGGEEFAVIFFDAGESTASRLMETIRESFSQVVHTNKANEFHVTLSCGIASFPHYRTAAELTEAADAALYRAKSTGRNRIVIA